MLGTVQADFGDALTEQAPLFLVPRRPVSRRALHKDYEPRTVLDPSSLAKGSAPMMTAEISPSTCRLVFYAAVVSSRRLGGTAG